jgi:hypothetical protein
LGVEYPATRNNVASGITDIGTYAVHGGGVHTVMKGARE